MRNFYGIIDDGTEDSVREMSIDLNISDNELVCNDDGSYICPQLANKTQTTESIIGGVAIETKITNNVMIIDDTAYNYIIKKENDELIIAGSEINKWYTYFINCVYSPKFFVITDKKKATKYL